MVRQRIRPLLYNRIDNPEDQETVWFFYFENTNLREMNHISGQIFKIAKPFGGGVLFEGKRKDIFYTMLRITTYNKEIDIGAVGKVYNGPVKLSKEIYDRESSDGLENIIVSDLEKRLI